MNSFARSFFASLLALVVLLALIVGIAALKLDHKTKIENHTFLVVDLYGALPEYDAPGDVVSQALGGEGETLQRVLSNLEKARVDKRIEGVILKLSSNFEAGAASLEEIRNALKKVQKADKPVYGFADSINPRCYFLAAVCDSIYAPPSAYITFHGFSETLPFVKGSLEKLGVKPNLHRIKDYKAAAELVTRKNLSDAARENLQWMLDETWDLFTQSLQEDRGLSEDQVKSIMELAMLTPEEAVEHRLVDRLLYWDEMADQFKLEKDERLRTVSQSRYAEVKEQKLGLNKGKKYVAVIHAHGLIGGRESGVDPLLGTMMGHDTVVAQLDRARRDKNVVAIVFRVDSGGGDSLTSDLIGHAVDRAAQEKPVVVSMVDVAASGGYSISYRGTKIVADPGTITGSIGSISGKFNLAGLFEKLGISFDGVSKGPMALFDSSFRDYTPQERERFEKEHWAGYNTWVADIAKHRGMSVDEVSRLAEGREWSGRQAAENGLVDELGDLDHAVALAKKLAEVPQDKKVAVRHFPQKQDFLQMVFSSEEELSLGVRAAVIRQFRAQWKESLNLLANAQLRLAPLATP
ncbi:MAG TPA: signal peptide peptidase SppA [Candidatus Krumholzibacteria bacterium]|nr:signal peptide peptidase SppA [Candidatus Krumholzibacteria bacterium]